MTPWWANLVSVFIGGVLGGVSSLWGVKLVQDRTDKRERNKLEADNARELDKEWRTKRTEGYLAYVNAVKRMRMISAQMAAELGLDDESEPLDLPEGTRSLVLADEARGITNEYVNFCGGATVIKKARTLNDAVWRLERFARQRYPNPTPEKWRRASATYATAVDDYLTEIRSEVGVPGEYLRREVVYPHADP